MKKTIWGTIASLMLCLMFNCHLTAQEKLHYWRDAETYLQDQASLIFEEADKVLAAYPPNTTVGSERMLALLSLDALLHDTRLDGGPAFREYMKHVADNVVMALQKNKPTGKKMRFFRFYDHGFIIQTASVTVGIDLIRGGKADNPYISDELMRSIVDQCDILFITHAHGDHADLAVAKMFREQGKQVIVPEEIWKDVTPPLYVLRGTDLIRETISLPKKNKSLTVQVYPGHQGKVLNNVYLITLPEGKTIMHTGDQDYTDDLVAQISSQAKVDVLLVHCWMMPMEKFVSGINPAFIICGHENEMGHTIDHREAYWLTFRRMAGVKVPYIVMAWGESYVL